jgi:hypothetical protein
MLRALPLVVLAAVAFAGCGEDEEPGAATTTTQPPAKVDTASVEKGIKQQLSTPEAQVTKVKCPDDVKAKQGATFKCSVTWSNGAAGKVKVTQTGINRFTYEPVEGSVQIPAAPVEAQLKEDLAQQGAPNAVVNCPDNIIIKTGTTVTCNVSSGGGGAHGSVTFTFSDATGTVDSSSVESS